MLCEKQTPIKSKLRDLEKIVSTRRQHAHGRNATTIFAYESEERESDKHAEMLSDSSGMPALVSASSSDESGGYPGYVSETESTDEASEAPVEVSDAGFIAKQLDYLVPVTGLFSLEGMRQSYSLYYSDEGITMEHIKN